MTMASSTVILSKKRIIESSRLVSQSVAFAPNGMAYLGVWMRCGCGVDAVTHATSVCDARRVGSARRKLVCYGTADAE